MVGSAIVRRLEDEPGVIVVTRERAQLDLIDQSSVNAFFAGEPIDEVYLSAARVGGIHANSVYPADFILDNLAIQTNVIQAAFKSGVSKLLFLGSSCIYPRDATQPMSEDALLTGPLEPTNEPYAIAKIAGIKLCESFNRQHGTDYRCVMPTNLYGPGDNFHPENSHVVPALLRRFHEARFRGDSEVTLWGTGTPRREFLHVDDMAAACVFVMGLSKDSLAAGISPRVSHINVGTGSDCSITELAQTLARVVDYSGSLVFDSTKPDGAPRKLLDVQRLRGLGWQSSISLPDGLRETYGWYLKNIDRTRS
ncbi:MAG: GDP-L-fucose synthase [Congregibacter sp.]